MDKKVFYDKLTFLAAPTIIGLLSVTGIYFFLTTVVRIPRELGLVLVLPTLLIGLSVYIYNYYVTHWDKVSDTKIFTGKIPFSVIIKFYIYSLLILALGFVGIFFLFRKAMYAGLFFVVAGAIAAILLSKKLKNSKYFNPERDR